MDTLKELVAKHKWTLNGMRTNLCNDPDNWVMDKGRRRWLKRGPYSNTLRDPSNPIVAHVQTLFPWANCVCLNRKRSTSPPMVAHRDKGNTSASMIAFWGDYDNSNGQGALCLEDGTEYREKDVWHGPYQGDKVTHWVRGHSSGVRYSCVIFAGPPARSTRRTSQTMVGDKKGDGAGTPKGSAASSGDS